MNAHRDKLRPNVQIVQRQIPDLIDLHLEQDPPSLMESEYEDVDPILWKTKVEETMGAKAKQFASGTETALINSNIQEINKRRNEVEAGQKEQMQVNSENAFRLGEQVLEKLQEFNETNTRIREEIERLRPPPPLREIDMAVENIEEDTEDELRNNNDTETQTDIELENDLPDDIQVLKVMIMDILNEDVKNTIPRIQRGHFKKLKSGLKLVFDRITNIFERLNENHITGKNEEERLIIELAFKCMTHRIRKHIADKIGKEPGKAKEKRLLRRTNRKNPGMHNEEDAEAEREIRIKVDAQQSALSNAIGRLKELRKLIVQRKLTDNGYKIYNMELMGRSGPHYQFLGRPACSWIGDKQASKVGCSGS
jgi:hypothetical protein